jgi:hypothetical protein
VRRLSAWLASEGEQTPAAHRYDSPKLDTKVLPSLTDDELRDLTKS